MPMRKNLFLFPPLLFLLLLLSGCYYSHPNRFDHWAAGNGSAVDSVNFYISHHYWKGYNFRAVDSFNVLTAPPIVDYSDYRGLAADSITIHRDEVVVVAQILHLPSDSTDSVWVKVAHDQLTQGWIHESVLLEKVIPDDPISQFIYHFSDSRTGFFLFCLGMAAGFALLQIFRRKHYRMVHFRDIPSFYPTLLCLCVSCSAALYGSIQRFAPSTWVEYYFHPTLNPFSSGLPVIMACFIASVWCIFIAAGAVADEIRRQPDLGDGVAYLASLGGVCFLLYLVFSLTVPIYIGYFLLPAYWFFAIRQYYIHRPPHLLCGVCGKSVPGKGRCPHCGADNE